MPFIGKEPLNDNYLQLDSVGDVTMFGLFTTESLSVTDSANFGGLFTAGSLAVTNAASFGGNVTIDGTVSGSYPVTIISSNTNAVSGNVYIFTSSLILSLPTSPTVGDWIKVSDRSGTTTSVIARSGSNIMGSATDLTLDVENASLELIYTDVTRGWVLL